MKIEEFIEFKNNNINIEHVLIQQYISEGWETKLYGNVHCFNLIQDMIGLGILKENEKGKISVLKSLTNTKSEDWIEKLHEDIKNVVKKKTGKSQYINGSGKSLVPSLVMLRNRLEVFIKKLGFDDKEKISKAILKYTEEVVSGKNKYALTLEYFIYKNQVGNGLVSELANRMENLDEEKSANVDVFEGVNI